MSKNLNYFFVFIMLAASMASAGVVNRFLTYSPSANRLAYISTDIEINPTLAANQVYCTGDIYNPSVQVQSDWYSSNYETLVASFADVVSCLTPYSSVAQNQPINWISSSTYSAFDAHSQFFDTVADYEAFVSPYVPNRASALEKTRYMRSFDGLPFEQTNGNVFFKGNTTMFCKGTANIASSNPAYNKPPLEYLGQSSLPFSSITLNTPGTYTFTSTFSLNGCIAAGRTYLTPSCGGGTSVDNVDFYKNSSIPASTFTTPVKSVTVRNPYVCNLAVSFVPNNATNGSNFPFTLWVTNNGNGPINITNIVLAPASQFTLVSIAPLPYNGLAAGATATFNGVLHAPAAVGMNTVSFVITSKFSELNCTGSVAWCNKTASFPINITANSSGIPASCSLSAPAHPSHTYAPVESASMVATCANSVGTVVPCGYLAWTTTAAGGSVSPPSTNTPPNPSQTTLTLGAVNAPQYNANVKAQQGANFSCLYLLNVTGPDYIISSLSAPSIMAVNLSFPVNVVTKNIGGATSTSTVTQLNFSSAHSNITVSGLGKNGTFPGSAVFACPPAPANITLRATADAFNSIPLEMNESNNNASATVQCVIIPPSVLPDYISEITAPATAYLGETFNVSVKTTNIGNGTASSVSQTILVRQFQSPVYFSVPVLAANGGSATNNTTATCTALGPKGLTSGADYLLNISEWNESNNQYSASVECIEAPAPSKPDYIILYPQGNPFNAQVGVPTNVTVRTRNNALVASTVNSTTRTTFNFASVNFEVPPLAGPGNHDSQRAIICPQEGIFTLSSFADFGFGIGAINESNETNNAADLIVNCTTAPVTITPNYVPAPRASPIIFQNVPFLANITTRNIGRVGAVSQSATTAVFESAIASFSVAPLAPDAEQSNYTNFTCTSIGPKTLVETVDVANSINESNETDNSVSLPLTCYRAPTNCSLSFVGHPPILSSSDSAVVKATCYLSGLITTACPPFLWQQSASHANVVPANTPASLSPNTTLNTYAAPQQLGQWVNATSTLAGLPLTCRLPFDISNAPVGPDYVVAAVVPSPQPALIGQMVHFTTTVANIGNVNGTNSTTVEATYSAGCSPVAASYNLPPVLVGVPQVDSSLACTCIGPGRQTVTIRANPSQRQWETSFDNNNRTITFICQTLVQLTCPDFV